MLQIKTKAPNFSLEDSNFIKRSLSEYQGKKVILYFYSKDLTPGCTSQAIGFKELFHHFQELNTIIIGISKDTPLSHQKFINQFQLPFLLLSDSELKVMKEYEVWQEKKMYGKVYFGASRTTYIIDERGMIEHFMTKGKAQTNAKEVLEYLNKTMFKKEE